MSLVAGRGADRCEAQISSRSSRKQSRSREPSASRGPWFIIFLAVESTPGKAEDQISAGGETFETQRKPRCRELRECFFPKKNHKIQLHLKIRNILKFIFVELANKSRQNRVTRNSRHAQFQNLKMDIFHKMTPQKKNLKH